jgi:hypothetical protein
MKIHLISNTSRKHIQTTEQRKKYNKKILNNMISKWKIGKKLYKDKKVVSSKEWNLFCKALYK